MRKGLVIVPLILFILVACYVGFVLVNRVCLQRALKAYKQGSYLKAIELSQRVEKMAFFGFGKDEARYLLALSYFKIGRRKQAKGILEDLVRRYPERTGYKVSLAVVYDSLGFTRAAISLYREVLERNPASVEALLGLGIGLAKLGEADKLREAETYLKKAAKLDPFNVKVLYNLGVVYFYQGKLKEAKDAWEKALKIKPGDPLLQKALAELSLYEAKYRR